MATIDFEMIIIKIKIAALSGIYFWMFTPNMLIMVGLVWVKFNLESLGFEALQKFMRVYAWSHLQLCQPWKKWNFFRKPFFSLNWQHNSRQKDGILFHSQASNKIILVFIYFSQHSEYIKNEMEDCMCLIFRGYSYFCPQLLLSQSLKVWLFC